MAAITIYSDFGDPKIKPATVSTVSPSVCHEVLGPDAWTTALSNSMKLSHDIKRHLLLGRKAMTNLNSVLKSGDISFLTKVL